MGLGCCMSCLAEETADGIGKALPNCALIEQSLTAAPRHLIDAPLAPGWRAGPAAAQQPLLLEAVERGINGPLRKVEGPAAARANFLDHRIAMRRSRHERGEHDHVEMTLEHFAFHRGTICLAIRGVDRKSTRL